HELVAFLRGQSGLQVESEVRRARGVGPRPPIQPRHAGRGSGRATRPAEHEDGRLGMYLRGRVFRRLPEGRGSGRGDSDTEIPGDDATHAPAPDARLFVAVIR